jgi:hypothetical protein
MKFFNRFRLSKSAVIAIVAVLCASVADFFSRVVVIREKNSVTFSNDFRQSEVPVDTAQTILARISKWIPLDVAQSASASLSPDQLLLSAVLLERSRERAVIAVLGPSGELLRFARVSVGDEIEGWNVQYIEARKVILRREQVSHELSLFRRDDLEFGGP